MKREVAGGAPAVAGLFWKLWISVPFDFPGGFRQKMLTGKKYNILLLFECMKETKLRIFQFKLLHRWIGISL